MQCLRATSSVPAPMRLHGTVLVIDDDPWICSIVADLLTDEPGGRSRPSTRLEVQEGVPPTSPARSGSGPADRLPRSSFRPRRVGGSPHAAADTSGGAQKPQRTCVGHFGPAQRRAWTASDGWSPLPIVPSSRRAVYKRSSQHLSAGWHTASRTESIARAPGPNAPDAETGCQATQRAPQPHRSRDQVWRGLQEAQKPPRQHADKEPADRPQHVRRWRNKLRVAKRAGSTPGDKRAHLHHFVRQLRHRAQRRRSGSASPGKGVGPAPMGETGGLSSRTIHGTPVDQCP